MIDVTPRKYPDPIERQVLVIGTDVRVSEINDAMMQLLDFLPPSKSALPLSEILSKIRQYIRTIVLTGCDVSINLLLFHIQVKCTPGHGIEIYIKRLLPVTAGHGQTLPPEQAEYTEIYTGERR